MAKAKLVAPYENFVGRDSLRSTPNGSVVFRRSGAPVTRAFTRPVQPNTPIQHTSRFIFSQAATTYNALSDADVLTWHNLGLTITRTNSAGFTYHPSSRQLWMENSLIAARNFQVGLSTAPSSVTFPPILAATAMAVQIGVNNLELTLPVIILPTSVILYMAGPLSQGTRSLAGKNWFNPALNIFDPGAGAAAWFDLIPGDTVIDTPLDALRIPLAVGQKWGIRLTVIDPNANISGPSYDAILTSTP